MSLHLSFLNYQIEYISFILALFILFAEINSIW